MKTVLVAVGIYIAIVAAGAFVVCHIVAAEDNRVEQKVGRSGLCACGTCAITYVWNDGDIIRSWYDDLPAMTDSLKAARRTEGEQLLTQARAFSE